MTEADFRLWLAKCCIDAKTQLKLSPLEIARVLAQELLTQILDAQWQIGEILDE